MMKTREQSFKEFESFLKDCAITYQTSNVLEDTLYGLSGVKPDIETLKRFEMDDSQIKFVYSGLSQKSADAFKLFLQKYDPAVALNSRATTTKEFPEPPTIARWNPSPEKPIQVYDVTLSTSIFCQKLLPLIQDQIRQQVKNDDSSLWRYQLYSDIYLSKQAFLVRQEDKKESKEIPTLSTSPGMRAK